ncbi:MAG TPA: transglutaminase-like cysteine peptidase, partial [Accumulibacter sp.]|nr:transglutaminase-like cysteine peptidase [Accumulibacter sp.]
MDSLETKSRFSASGSCRFIILSKKPSAMSLTSVRQRLLLLINHLYRLVNARAGGLVRCLCKGLLAVFVCFNVEAGLGLKDWQALLIARFGPARVTLLNDWYQLVMTSKGWSEDYKLQRVNDFFNKNISFDDDISIWQQSDYWATPLETMGQGRGDCEDFAIAKYFTLRMAGVPLNKMRLIYVKAKLTTPVGENQQAHMVLAYYARPGAEPLVLDNLQSSIQPASKRHDLRPVFSFNSEGVFAGVAGTEKVSAGGPGRLSR